LSHNQVYIKNKKKVFFIFTETNQQILRRRFRNWPSLRKNTKTSGNDAFFSVSTQKVVFCFFRWKEFQRAQNYEKKIKDFETKIEILESKLLVTLHFESSILMNQPYKNMPTYLIFVFEVRMRQQEGTFRAF
jgi:hypothetical protein